MGQVSSKPERKQNSNSPLPLAEDGKPELCDPCVVTDLFPELERFLLAESPAFEGSVKGTMGVATLKA